MIELKNVSKRYGESKAAALAVDGISFTVPTGTLTTLLGPSGCGKPTTLRMIAGLESPTSGEIWMARKQGQVENVMENVTKRAAHERNVSLVFQNYALFPHMNVLDNVSYGLKMTNVKRVDAKARAIEALKNVGLVGFDDRLPSELSGGQQQRVALARALVLEPAVLLFDEPLSNLDAQLRRAMREEIRNLQQRLQLTVAYVTHDLVEALAVSDHIVVMDHGVIAQMGTPQEVFEQPKSDYVKNFLGEAAMLRDDINLFLQWQK